MSGVHLFPPLSSVFPGDLMLHYGHCKGWQRWPSTPEGSHFICLVMPVEGKVHFPKHLANFLKMLIGSGWPGLGHEIPDELSTMSRRSRISGLPWTNTNREWGRGCSSIEKPKGGKRVLGRQEQQLPTTESEAQSPPL